MLLSSPAHFLSHIWKTISTSQHADCPCHSIATTHLVEQLGQCGKEGGPSHICTALRTLHVALFLPPSLPFSVSPHPTQSVLIGRTEDGGVRDLARIHPSPFPPPKKNQRATTRAKVYFFPYYMGNERVPQEISAAAYGPFAA